MLAIAYAKVLLEMSAGCFEVQAETARQYAKAGRDIEANVALAKELDSLAKIIREALDNG